MHLSKILTLALLVWALTGCCAPQPDIENPPPVDYWMPMKPAPSRH